MAKIDIKGTTKRVYDFIVEFSDIHGYPPSVREIADATRIKSTSTVFYHLTKLEDAGALKKSGMKNRAIEILDKKSPSREVTAVPIVGKVAAGMPILAVENVTDTVELPTSFFPGTSLFLLRVQGDSMIDAGILDGDLIVVNKQNYADNGEIIVAMIDDEATVKRFFRESDHIRLQPENDAYEPIISDNVTVVGKVVGLIRKEI